MQRSFESVLDDRVPLRALNFVPRSLVGEDLGTRLKSSPIVKLLNCTIFLSKKNTNLRLQDTEHVILKTLNRRLSKELVTVGNL